MRANFSLKRFVQVGLFLCVGTAMTLKANDSAGFEILPSLGHTDRITDLQVSPDGKLLASASDDNRVFLWDMESGELVRVFSGGISPVGSIAWSSDGDLIASVGDGGVLVHEVATGRRVRALKDIKSRISDSVAFSDDGTKLVSGGDQAIVWDLEAGTIEARWDEDAWFVFFKSESEIITNRYLWNLDTGKKKDLFVGTGAKFTQDKQGVVRIHLKGESKRVDQMTAEELKRMWGKHEQGLSAIAVSQARDRYATASFDNSVKVWDGATGVLKETFEDVSVGMSLAFDPSGNRLACGTLDGRLFVWNLDTAERILEAEAHEGPVRAVTWSRDGSQILSGGDDRTIIAWDAVGGELLKQIDGSYLEAYNLAWSPSGKHMASGHGDGGVRVWNLSEGKMQGVVKSGGGYASSLSWSPSGNWIAAGNDDGRIRIFRSDTLELHRELDGGDLSISSLSWSLDSTRLLSASMDRSLKVWQVGALKLEREISTGGAAAWSPSGRDVAFDPLGESVSIWNTQNGLTNSNEKLPGKAYQIVWSGDSSLVGILGVGEIVLWEISPNEVKLISLNEWEDLLSISLDVDGSRIVGSFQQNAIGIWNFDTDGSFGRIEEAHLSDVSMVAWSPDDRLFASSSLDGSLKVWDANAGRSIMSLLALPEGEWICFSEERGWLHKSDEADRFARVSQGGELLELGEFLKVRNEASKNSKSEENVPQEASASE